MRLRFLFVVLLVYGSIAAGQSTSKALVRFSNDSAKAASFYLDGQLGCSVPANPEENNAYCDAETSIGKHKVSVSGAKLRSQSCQLYISRYGLGDSAEALLSKGEVLHCASYVYD
jgi:hypothetical protein